MTSALYDDIVEVIPTTRLAAQDPPSPWAAALGDLPIAKEETLETARGIEFQLRSKADLPLAGREGLWSGSPTGLPPEQSFLSKTAPPGLERGLVGTEAGSLVPGVRPPNGGSDLDFLLECWVCGRRGRGC